MAVVQRDLQRSLVELMGSVVSDEARRTSRSSGNWPAVPAPTDEAYRRLTQQLEELKLTHEPWPAPTSWLCHLCNTVWAPHIDFCRKCSKV